MENDNPRIGPIKGDNIIDAIRMIAEFVKSPIPAIIADKIMNKKNKHNALNEELTAAELKEKDMQLFDQADKPFLTLYLFIFVLGIFLTIISI